MLRSHTVMLTIPLLAGCSLIFDGSAYEGAVDAGSSGADAGLDAGLEDAGTDAGGADAGVDRLPCDSHETCTLSESLDDYVCVPSPMSMGGQFYCAPSCENAEDCGAFGGGVGHDEGSLCLATGDCGCETGEHCEDPAFPSCDRASQRCEETGCTSNAECMGAGLACFGGRCQLVNCTGPADCTGEGSAACLPAPPGMSDRICSDFCMAAPDCGGRPCTDGTCA